MLYNTLLCHVMMYMMLMGSYAQFWLWRHACLCICNLCVAHTPCPPAHPTKKNNVVCCFLGVWCLCFQFNMKPFCHPCFHMQSACTWHMFLAIACFDAEARVLYAQQKILFALCGLAIYMLFCIQVGACQICETKLVLPPPYQIFKLSRVSFPKNVRFQKTQLGKQNVDWKLMDVVGSAAARGTLHTAVGLFFLTYSIKKVHEVNIFISVPCMSFCHCTPLSIWNLQGTGLEDVSPYGGFG